MKLYHGSYIEIDKIDLTKSQPYKDFGKAFYVTKLREQAEYWSARKGKDNKTQGFVTEYNFPDNAFSISDLKVLRFEDYTEEWLDFVVLNRKAESEENPHDYDIVEGPIADDAIATQIEIYLAGGFTKSAFIEHLRFKHRTSHQIAFCTLNSLVFLKKSWNKIDLNEFTIDEAVVQSLFVDFNLTEQQAIDLYFQSGTYKQLTDKTTKLHEKPWKEIYTLLLVELKLKKNEK